MKTFIDLALSKGVKRFVLLSASLLDVADGPAMSRVSKYVSEKVPEWAVLRPTWFMGTLPLNMWDDDHTDSYKQRISQNSNSSLQSATKISSLLPQAQAAFRSFLQTTSLPLHTVPLPMLLLITQTTLSSVRNCFHMMQ